MLENFKGKENSNGFDKRPEDGKKGGRKMSFKARYKELYNDNQSVVWVDANSVLHRNRQVKEDGVVVDEVPQYGLQLTRVDVIIARLDRLVMGAKNDRTSLEAIKFLWEQIDGKARQAIAFQDDDGESVRPVVNLTINHRKKLDLKDGYQKPDEPVKPD